jgi:hypothetical protein
MPTDNHPPKEGYSGEYNSHLFTLRVWREVTGPADAEWRGRLQHVLSGQVCYFRDWGALLSNVLSLLSTEGQASSQLASDSSAGHQAEPGQGEQDSKER